MQEKNKETVLKIIILTAIILTAISFFAPMASIDYSDVLDDLEKQGYNPPRTYVKKEVSLVLWKHSIYDFSDPNSPSEHHSYRLFNLIEFETEKPINIDSTLINPKDLDLLNEKGDIFFSTNIASLIYVALFPIGLAIFIYLIYKGFKNIGIKKTKYFLYLSILTPIISILFIAANYFYIDTIDFYNLNYINYMIIEYGFYIGMAGIILFFIAYILQQYFIKITEKKLPEDADIYSAT